MPIVFALDEGRTNHSIYDFAATAGVTLGAAVTQTSRNWVKSLIGMTPPSRKDILGSTQAQKKYGESKATKDIQRLFPLVDNLVSGMNERFKTAIRNKAANSDVGAVSKMLQDAGFKRVVSVLVGPKRQMHLDNANKTFHIPKANAGKYPVMSKSAQDAYTKMVLAKVGWMKGGWNTAANKLGVRVPAWVKRHANAPGSFTGIKDRVRPEIEFGNEVKAIDDRYYEVMLQSSGYQAFKLIQKQTEFYMKELGRGNGDKMRARAQAQTREVLDA